MILLKFIEINLNLAHRLKFTFILKGEKGCCIVANKL